MSKPPSDPRADTRPSRRPWRAPDVRKLAAGAAENGFGGADDGPFTGS
ncbi:hypothetical protein [Sphingomonas sp.]|nr:hypothetical protein [Sphingomonas sp.]